MKSKESPENFSPKEVAERFTAALRGARIAGHKPMESLVKKKPKAKMAKKKPGK
jgi:hypothetical protein